MVNSPHNRENIPHRGFKNKTLLESLPKGLGNRVTSAPATGLLFPSKSRQRRLAMVLRHQFDPVDLHWQFLHW